MTSRKSYLGISAILLVACTAAAPALAGSAAAHRTAAQNRRAAIRDAGRLLSRVHVPPGSTPSSREPGGDHRRLSRPFATQTGDLIYKHTWWTAHESPDAVISFVEAHPPAGGKQTMTGSSGQCEPHHFPPTDCHTTAQFVGFSLPPVPGVLGTRWVLFEVVQLHGGVTGIRADAEVQWIAPRSPAERVPDGARVVSVVRTVPGQRPSVDRLVTRRSVIRRIIRLIDRLPALQPGAIVCPGERAGAPIVTLTFRGAPGKPAIAKASVRSDVSRWNNACEAMSFWIGRKLQTPLVQARHFLKELGRLLKVQLTSPAGY